MMVGAHLPRGRVGARVDRMYKEYWQMTEKIVKSVLLYRGSSACVVLKKFYRWQ